MGMGYGAVCLTLFAMGRQVPLVQCCWSVAASVGAVDVHGLCSWGSLLGFSEQLSTAKFSKRKNNSPRYCGGGDIRKAIKDTLDSSRVLR